MLTTVFLTYRRTSTHSEAEALGTGGSVVWEIRVGPSGSPQIRWLSNPYVALWSRNKSNCHRLFKSPVVIGNWGGRVITLTLWPLHGSYRRPCNLHTSHYEASIDVLGTGSDHEGHIVIMLEYKFLHAYGRHWSVHNIVIYANGDDNV